jgi:hypothetical protein
MSTTDSVIEAKASYNIPLKKFAKKHTFLEECYRNKIGDLQMKKLKIYLDTSVISHLQADDVPEKMAITHKFWGFTYD